jgi:O-succinylbenzoate synthase
MLTPAHLPPAVAYATPLRTRFRGLSSRDGLLLRGDAGWGEFSPFWDYGAAESAAWLAAALEAATTPWPAPRRTHVPVNVTIPAVDPERAYALVQASGGCTTAKVKVAEPARSGESADPAAALAQDQARLEAVRDALGPAGRIRIDPNGAWSLEEALDRLPVLDRAAGGLEYAEQPCARVADLAALRRRLEVPIAADESIRRAEDPFEVVRAGAADVAVLKVQPLGGVRSALYLAERLGLPAVVSSALETSVGIAAGLALAAALPELRYACGLATVSLLERDAVEEPLLPVDGALAVRRPEPSPGSLGAIRADLATTRRWRARLAEVAEVAEVAETGPARP